MRTDATLGGAPTPGTPMMCGEVASRPVRKKSVRFFPDYCVTLFHSAGRCTAPGGDRQRTSWGRFPALPWFTSRRTVSDRKKVIGMEVGQHRDISNHPRNPLASQHHARSAPPKTIPVQRLFPTTVVLQMDAILSLKGWKVNTVILDTSKETWTSAVTLQVACPENAPQAKGLSGIHHYNRPDFVSYRKRHNASWASNGPSLPFIAKSGRENMEPEEARTTPSYPDWA